ncbi:MAG: hypothetical protein JW874_11040 [Spirochaetales bacterium]|nr:hypothetical protein [Spirochaetales bacterium]
MKITRQLELDFPGNEIAFKSAYTRAGDYEGFYFIVNGKKILLHITSGFLDEMELQSEKGKTLYWMFVKYMIDIFSCEPEQGSLADSLRFTVDEEQFLSYLDKRVRDSRRNDSRERYNHVPLPEYEGSEEEIYRKIMEEYKGKFDDLSWYKDMIIE